MREQEQVSTMSKPTVASLRDLALRELLRSRSLVEWQLRTKGHADEYALARYITREGELLHAWEVAEYEYTAGIPAAHPAWLRHASADAIEHWLTMQATPVTTLWEWLHTDWPTTKPLPSLFKARRRVSREQF